MEDREQETGSRPGHASDAEPSPVRSRWTPKPEQILILESIFNSGMVNPPKDETVRIRKLLEKFGTVGDANVFYWFQNRRSRSRRRQRQIQASLSTAPGGGGEPPSAPPRGGAIQYQSSGFPGNQGSGSAYNPGSSGCLMGSGSGFGFGGNDSAASEDIFGFSGHTALGIQEMEQNSIFLPSDSSSLQNYQPGVITVFINGVSTEVSRGPLDMKSMFGDFMLFHSSGMPVEVNEYGFLVQSLQHGESYFLVPRHS